MAQGDLALKPAEAETWELQPSLVVIFPVSYPESIEMKDFLLPWSTVGDICEDAAYCDTSSRLCTVRLATGEFCEDSEQCIAGNECAAVQGTDRCRAIQGRGESCEQACAAGLACKGRGGTCAPAFCATDPWNPS